MLECCAMGLAEKMFVVLSSMNFKSVCSKKLRKVGRFCGEVATH